jgi:hypothetical protein
MRPVQARTTGALGRVILSRDRKIGIQVLPFAPASFEYWFTSRFCYNSYSRHRALGDLKQTWRVDQTGELARLNRPLAKVGQTNPVIGKRSS